ncbi:hypothetical protein MAPG_08917 [Magnaporthiopsis poae ATCC 64411]|uniref:Uncharacterized protein n=1 Tax=Magnaporthiopsis poae (strain ATCC 64411 / 73-15) TaxID=644358 RepID=A0A0C4E8K8_MAGP6|nr:hypothetical protein MAPG_08917 [Magnaporthiopsis poae ATCC 64411]
MDIELGILPAQATAVSFAPQWLCPGPQIDCQRPWMVEVEAQSWGRETSERESARISEHFCFTKVRPATYELRGWLGAEEKETQSTRQITDAVFGDEPRRPDGRAGQWNFETGIKQKGHFPAVGQSVAVTMFSRVGGRAAQHGARDVQVDGDIFEHCLPAPVPPAGQSTQHRHAAAAARQQNMAPAVPSSISGLLRQAEPAQLEQDRDVGYGGIHVADLGRVEHQISAPNSSDGLASGSESARLR